ncbi:hypothetical protein F5050DRAFT_126496 [Lentinula boryana]|uniref:Uncharacterized protein n=1 Tax=Lentinula boryana TaxID=40481 RepID=A0ABQ8QCW2_9AGAR|nr:hypothetical protein F5050DRAFT_126496 [Lentinula boryana]
MCSTIICRTFKRATRKQDLFCGNGRRAESLVSSCCHTVFWSFITSRSPHLSTLLTEYFLAPSYYRSLFVRLTKPKAIFRAKDWQALPVEFLPVTESHQWLDTPKTVIGFLLTPRFFVFPIRRTVACVRPSSSIMGMKIELQLFIAHCRTTDWLCMPYLACVKPHGDHYEVIEQCSSLCQGCVMLFSAQWRMNRSGSRHWRNFHVFRERKPSIHDLLVAVVSHPGRLQTSGGDNLIVDLFPFSCIGATICFVKQVHLPVPTFITAATSLS